MGVSGAQMRRRRAAFGRELDRGGMGYAPVYGANRRVACDFGKLLR